MTSTPTLLQKRRVEGVLEVPSRVEDSKFKFLSAILNFEFMIH